ncbi:MBL fold metallo-hydrolase [Parvibaculum sp.]|uniref:MBL fold metallo-hydrolase n=1 Tax=Parvibaculum sp. TaxID=2024848 RepID=UPI000C92A193|nr:MBL fold metallo-hydrolase [Parvibaculum sp.]MAB14124.1 hypothetical protein [Parvibaculum sp.]
MEIQLIRNATLRLRFSDQTLLIDPWLAPKGEGKSYAGRQRSPLSDLPLPPQEIVGDVDAVVISHLHSDHFDSHARSVLPRKIPILCAARDASAIRAYGFQEVRAVETDVILGSVRIKLTGGRHGPDEVLEEMGDVSGFLFQATDEPTLYWAGDTILCEEVSQEIEDSSPEVIVVHACGAQWKGVGPLVMNENMVETILSIAPGAQIVATHLDSVDHATTSRSSLKAHFSADVRASKRLHIPEDGETISFLL